MSNWDTLAELHRGGKNLIAYIGRACTLDGSSMSPEAMPVLVVIDNDDDIPGKMTAVSQWFLYEGVTEKPPGFVTHILWGLMRPDRHCGRIFWTCDQEEAILSVELLLNGSMSHWLMDILFLWLTTAAGEEIVPALQTLDDWYKLKGTEGLE